MGNSTTNNIPGVLRLRYVWRIFIGQCGFKRKMAVFYFRQAVDLYRIATEFYDPSDSRMWSIAKPYKEARANLAMAQALPAKMSFRTFHPVNTG
jgi:hypothetical protein